MHLNSRAENASLSLNFLGRKLRNHTVTPAAKQQAWARTSPSRNVDENGGGLSRTVRTQPIVCAQTELPGSIQELREEVQHQSCNVHNTRLDQENNADPNVASGSTRTRDREDEASADLKIFIPYDSAKLCITQIADDMVAMKSRHLEMVQELEENFLMVSRENQQERTVNRIRSYYQNKLNSLKRILELYQEKVERRSALWNEKIESLQDENERLQEEQKTLQERNRHDSATWEREKDSSDSNAPLDGAKARLEELQEGLYKREREISMLIDGSEVQKDVPPSAYAHLLAAVVCARCAHLVYAEVTEAKQQFDRMAEDSRKVVAEATARKTSIQHNQTDVKFQEPRPLWMDQSDSSSGQVIQAGVNLQKQEVLLVALECIKAGVTPTLTGAVSEQDMAVEDECVKIRVFCRLRPQTQAELARGSCTIVSCLDDYSVSLETARGPREFQFDRIFTTEHTQDDVFQESSRLIQSAVDGFNVCIFAYGQTGSGKTFTMLGDREQKNPGIIPRTFNRIFEIIQENESKFEFKVLASMLELYNDRLQDLFVSPSEALSKRIEIKKDKKGLVFAQGAEAKEATSAGELFALFELGSANRHIAATKMNIESSRSHLIISIMLESRNLANGNMTFGKLNLVDLAGSERAAKTGAKDDQLKEANSINKSLSALGDVISALAMDQAHVPYRNNKLTQLMQDSLGGNSKTLMFLNISPSDCNLDETHASLM
ncbi:Kinesin-like protein KIN-14E [Bagarius yarrelli]|uniref:Kinesin-like protein n=1 Tax=Bagarius yarrelli TaxID=175774 RepID=A0A556V0S3_BAGYA|nr:Kinesin-like protein KIN-14E [Bagarius yarrelli]